MVVVVLEEKVGVAGACRGHAHTRLALSLSRDCNLLLTSICMVNSYHHYC